MHHDDHTNGVHHKVTCLSILTLQYQLKQSKKCLLYLSWLVTIIIHVLLLFIIICIRRIFILIIINIH